MIIHRTLYSYTGGEDYTSGPYNITFPAGQTRVTFTVNINQDNELDDSEYFNLAIKQTRLLSSNRVTVVADTRRQTKVIIMDSTGM